MRNWHSRAACVCKAMPKREATQLTASEAQWEDAAAQVPSARTLGERTGRDIGAALGQLGYTSPEDLVGLTEEEVQQLSRALPGNLRGPMRALTEHLNQTRGPGVLGQAGTPPGHKGRTEGGHTNQLLGHSAKRVPSAWEVADFIGALPSHKAHVDRLLQELSRGAAGPRSTIREFGTARRDPATRSKVEEYVKTSGHLNVLFAMEGSYASAASGVRCWAAYHDEFLDSREYFAVTFTKL